MNFSIFSRKKPSSGFIDSYTELTKTLTETYLPLLHQSRSSAASSDVLSANIDQVLSHLNKYYETTPTRLSTSSLETPFLLLGDIHPYIFTNLLRTFIDQNTQDTGHVSITLTQEADLSTEFVSAWTEPSDQLLTQINRVECRTRMIVPNLLERLRIVQRGYVARILKKPITAKTVKDETLMHEETEELVRIFVDANNLRKSVITSIVRDMTVHQATLFLEALCDILVGFKDQVCKEEEEDWSKLLVCNFVSGVIAVPSYFLVMGSMTKREKNIAMWTFAAAVVGSAISTFDSSIIKDKSRMQSLQESCLAMVSFFLGGILPVITGLIIPAKDVKIFVTVALTTMLIASVVVFDYKRKPGPKKLINAGVLVAVTVLAIAISVGFSDVVSHLRA